MSDELECTTDVEVIDPAAGKAEMCLLAKQYMEKLETEKRELEKENRELKIDLEIALVSKKHWRECYDMRTAERDRLLEGHAKLTAELTRANHRASNPDSLNDVLTWARYDLKNAEGELDALRECHAKLIAVNRRLQGRSDRLAGRVDALLAEPQWTAEKYGWVLQDLEAKKAVIAEQRREIGMLNTSLVAVGEIGNHQRQQHARAMEQKEQELMARAEVVDKLYATIKDHKAATIFGNPASEKLWQTVEDIQTGND